MITPDKKFARPLTRSEIYHEHNELTNEIKKYNAAIRKLSDEIDATAEQKRKLSLKLDANRTVTQYITKDAHRANSELYSMKSALDEYAAQVQHREVTQMRNLQSTMQEQITNVDNNSNSIDLQMTSLRDIHNTNMSLCADAVNTTITAIHRWTLLWPVLHLWLMSEPTSGASISGAAALHGLVAEWRSLRTLAMNIKNMSDHSRNLAKPGTQTSLTFNTSLSDLKKSMESKADEYIRDIRLLKEDVKYYEKQRKYLKSLLLELMFALDVDVSNNISRAENFASLPKFNEDLFHNLSDMQNWRDVLLTQREAHEVTRTEQWLSALQVPKNELSSMMYSVLDANMNGAKYNDMLKALAKNQQSQEEHVNSENVRGVLASAECRNMIRNLQTSMIKYALLEIDEAALRVPKNETLRDKMMSAARIEETKRHKKDIVRMMEKKVQYFHDWTLLRRQGMQTAVAVNSFYPCSPTWLIHQAMLLARGPMRKPVVIQEPEKTPVPKRENAAVSVGAYPMPTRNISNKRASLTSSERREHKTQRLLRIQSLALKFKTKLSSGIKVPVIETQSSSLKPSEMVASKEESEDEYEEDEDHERSQHEEDAPLVVEEPKHVTFVPFAMSPVPVDATEEEECKYNAQFIQSYANFSILESLIEKDVPDQMLTQLTLRLGNDPLSMVFYWQPCEERLRIIGTALQGNEEYNFHITQSDVHAIFAGEPYLQACQLQNPHLLNNLVQRMDIEKMPRAEALELMMRVNKMSRQETEKMDSASKLSRTALIDEEDKLKVLTIRHHESGVFCNVAKVRNSHWENLLAAVPKHQHRENSIEQLLAKSKPQSRSGRATVF